MLPPPKDKSMESYVEQWKWNDKDMDIEKEVEFVSILRPRDRGNNRKMQIWGVYPKMHCMETLGMSTPYEEMVPVFLRGRKVAYSISCSEIQGTHKQFKYSKSCRKELYWTLFNPALFKLTQVWNLFATVDL